MAGSIASLFTAVQYMLPAPSPTEIRYPDGSGVGA